MITNTNLENIFSRLKNHGIDKNFVKEILLPEWWNEEVTFSKAGYLQTLSILANNLKININDLLEGTGTISLQNPLPIRFKKAENINVSLDDIWPNALASRITDLVNNTFSIPLSYLPTQASELRNIFLSSYERIELNSVLDFLWRKGIPVLYVSQFPRDVHKMDGMVVKSDDRYVIIVSKTRKHNAWLLFIILHELGHILKNHLSESGSVIYDLEIELETDNEEKEANREALVFLSNSPEPRFIEGKFQTGFQLANTAMKKAKEYNLDPGVLALNYAYLNNNFPLAQQALRILDPEANAISLIKNKMKQYLSLDNLSEENYDFFVKVSSLQEE
ncbi:MAG: hypothetical protein B6D44_10215 [Ignavibacteriales bacterium UTCHB2]|jgi:Zn-dependent peptidase ImmA (M78 family)|nr:MAG: hypothetical protein B6D44_10215 [Ignavibacteriales bacterium UTCHB2]